MEYQNGKIYKIWFDTNNDFYIGSTCQKLCQRMTHHKTDAKKYPDRLLYEQMHLAGDEFTHITLIESYPCTNKDELRSREQHV